MAFGLNKETRSKEDNLHEACLSVGIRVVRPAGATADYGGNYSLSTRAIAAVVLAVRKGIKQWTQA